MSASQYRISSTSTKSIPVLIGTPTRRKFELGFIFSNDDGVDHGIRYLVLGAQAKFHPSARSLPVHHFIKVMMPVFIEAFSSIC